jgi:hypothetical protein
VTYPCGIVVQVVQWVTAPPDTAQPQAPAANPQPGRPAPPPRS